MSAPATNAFSPTPDDHAAHVVARGDLVVIVSHGGDLDAILEAELAATPSTTHRSRVPEIVASVIVSIVVSGIAYLLLSR